MPTLTSKTPAYKSAMEKIGLNMMCENIEEWRMKLEKCIMDEEYRRKAGTLGKRVADSEYSNISVYNQWDKLIKDLSRT